MFRIKGLHSNKKMDTLKIIVKSNFADWTTFEAPYDIDLVFYEPETQLNHRIGYIRFKMFNLHAEIMEGYTRDELFDLILDEFPNFLELQNSNEEVSVALDRWVENILIIESVYIEPSFRRTGFAQKALETVLQNMLRKKQLILTEINVYEYLPSTELRCPLDKVYLGIESKKSFKKYSSHIRKLFHNLGIFGIYPTRWMFSVSDDIQMELDQLL